VISQNAKWGHAGFYIDCHRMTVPENILLQKSTDDNRPVVAVYHKSVNSESNPLTPLLEYFDLLWVCCTTCFYIYDKILTDITRLW